MVPNVHLWVVEDIPKRSEGNAYIGVIKVSHCQCKHMYEEEVLDTKSNHGERDILEGTIDDSLHPVKAEVRCKPHLFDRVMYLVELPQKRDAVKQSVNVEVDEVAGQKQQGKLRPGGPGLDMKGDEVFDPKPAQKLVERVNKDVTESVVPNQRKEEEVEEHIEPIEPEISTNGGLLNAPGFDDLPGPEKQRDRDESIKVTAPGGLCDISPEVTSIILKRCCDNVPIFFHCSQRLLVRDEVHF